MATKEENISRKEAIRRAVRKFSHNLRQLQTDIKAFNSRLFCEELITEDIRAKEDIDETLSVIRTRLEDDAVTESTFDEFVKAIGEKPSREHLKKNLLDLVDQQFKGRPQCSEHRHEIDQQEKIGMKHAPTTADLMTYVAQKIPTKWYEIGILLKIETSTLDGFEAQGNNQVRLFIKVFDQWEKEQKVPYTWDTIISALEANGENKTAAEIRRMT